MIGLLLAAMLVLAGCSAANPAADANRAPVPPNGFSDGGGGGGGGMGM